MRKRRLPKLAAGAAVLALLAGDAAAGTMLFRSSAAFDGGGTDSANAVAVSSRRVYAAGERAGDFYTVRYDTALAVVASAAFDAGGVEIAHAVAVGPSGSVYVAGEKDSHVLLVKYDAALNFVSSAAFSLGNEDIAYGLAVDASENVFAAGYTFDGATFKILALKFTSGLALAAQRAFSMGTQSWGYALALDASGNPIVTGRGLDADFNVKLARLSPSTLATSASASFDGGGNDEGHGAAVEPSGAVMVAAQSAGDLLALRFSSSLTLLSSATYDGGGADLAWAAAAGASGSVLCGEVKPGGVSYGAAIRYSSSLVSVSSVTVRDGSGERVLGCALDSDGSLFAAGATDAATGNFAVRRYAGPPAPVSSTKAQQGGIGQVVTFSGDNFASGGAVSLGDPGFTLNGSGAASPASFVMNLDAPATLALGSYAVTLTNTDGQSATSSALLRVVKTVAIPTAAGGPAVAQSTSGVVRVDIPAGTFASDIDLELSRPAALPAAGTLQATGIAFESQETPALAPTKDVVVRLGYTLGALGAIPESRLTLAYYDTGLLAWVAMPSTVDTVNKVVIATSTHLTLFQIMATPQPAAAGGVGTVAVFPNPYKPGSSGPYGDAPGTSGVTFTNMPADFRLEVFDSAGRRVYDGHGRSSSGRFLWDTGVSGGGKAPSGVYVFLVHDDAGGPPRKGKFVVIR